MLLKDCTRWSKNWGLSQEKEGRGYSSQVNPFWLSRHVKAESMKPVKQSWSTLTIICADLGRTGWQVSGLPAAKHPHPGCPCLSSATAAAAAARQTCLESSWRGGSTGCCSLCPACPTPSWSRSAWRRSWRRPSGRARCPSRSSSSSSASCAPGGAGSRCRWRARPRLGCFGGETPSSCSAVAYRPPWIWIQFVFD